MPGVARVGGGYPLASAGGLCEFLNFATQFAFKNGLAST